MGIYLMFSESTPSRVIRIKVITTDGASLTICVPDRATVYDVKLKLHEKLKLIPARQRLIFMGRELSNDEPAENVHGSCIHLAVASPTLSIDVSPVSTEAHDESRRVSDAVSPT